MTFHRPIYGSTHTNTTTTKNQNFNQLLVIFFLGGRLRDSSSTLDGNLFLFFYSKKCFFFLSKSPKQVNEVVVFLKKEEKRQSRVSLLSNDGLLCMCNQIDSRPMDHFSSTLPLFVDYQREKKEKTPNFYSSFKRKK